LTATLESLGEPSNAMIIDEGNFMKHVVFAIAASLCALILTACERQTSPAPAVTPAAVTQPATSAASELKVIAYYMGDGSDLARYNFSQLTHVIYSFLHLNGNQLAFDSETDKEAFRRLIALKKDHPQLKVLLSLGGWGGCETCSDIFSSAENRLAFAESTLALLKEYQADGLDLDWEYPVLPSVPGHAYGPHDKPNFTELVKLLREKMGKDYELSFAAGGFEAYVTLAVDWDAIMPLLDNVNLMSYDIVNGGTPHTGHHTALYSTPEQKDSTDHAVQLLLKKGIAPEKIVIGAAFYARTWKDVANTNNGLYQPGTHIDGIHFKDYATQFTQANGYESFWDDVAKAAYVYNAKDRVFATFDDKRSIKEKMQYVKQHKLVGIMFWQLPHDASSDGLLDTIYREKVGTAVTGEPPATTSSH
jgi:chitinase